ncbi:MAG TPA: Ig-like domain-containing protein, partial [Thermoanaerobaculia bacterium]
MHQPGRSLLALGFALALSSSTAFASVLWFGDNSGLHAIDTTTNTIAASVAMEPPVAVAVNAADGSVWVLTQSRISHLSSSGAILFDRAHRDFGTGLGAPRLLALNPNDGSVWAAYETRVIHFDAGGVVQGTLSVAALALAIGQDGSLWTLGSSSLHRYDSTGNLTRITAVAATRRMKFIALDDTGGAVWLAGEREVVKLSAASPDTTSLSFFAPETISALSLDAQSGDLWLLGQQSLFSYRRDGSPAVSRDLRDFSVANPRVMLYDFGSQAAWVGHQGGLSRISSFGALVATFAADVRAGTIAIGSAPVDITPVVSIVSPADGALVNSATPRITVGYDAMCGGNACGFPNSFFATFTLSALLNGVETGPSFAFDAATGTSSFTPSSPLPEGTNTLSAKATDSFGHESATVSIAFTVDTIAPSFGAV